MPDDDRELVTELNRLDQALDPFTSGIRADTLSVDEQLDFGFQLIKVAARIRARVEKGSARPAGDGDTR